MKTSKIFVGFILFLRQCYFVQASIKLPIVCEDDLDQVLIILLPSPKCHGYKFAPQHPAKLLIFKTVCVVFV